MAESRAQAAVAGSDLLVDRRLPWSRVGLAALPILAVLGAIYWGILRDLVRQWWEDPNYSHGFLVPVFSAFLIWQGRARLAALPASGSWVGLPVILGGLGALILGNLGAELFLTRMSLLVLLAGLLLFHLGTQVFRAVAFPLAYLSFMVPIPAIVFYAVAFPLQGLAAENAAWVLDTLGVPVLLDGNVIHLSQLSLGVTEACSGIRSLISLLALAVAWAVLTLPRVWPRALLIAAAVPITVVANAGRVVATGLIGQVAGVEYATGFFHLLSGWAIFVVAFAGLLGVHALIQCVMTRFAGTGRPWRSA